ncbi:MAG: tetratricopeptide repeat protein [Microcystaceae cyanobacterium]
MTNSPIEVAIERYEAALTILEEATAESSPAEKVLEVLVTRDAIQAMLIHSNQIFNPQLIKIIQLDNRLKQQAPKITQTANLADWRESFQPAEEAWWWFFEPSLHRRDQLDWLWSGLSVAFLTVSLSLVVDISSRFLSGGANALGALAVSTQSILTLLTAKSALTETGQKGIQNLLSRLKLPKYLWNEVQLGLSGLLLLGLYGLYSALPLIGDFYRRRGIKNFEAGHLASAESYYRRALALNPNDVKTNFYLGLLYEDLKDLENARLQYRIAVLGGYKEAFNNLARLYILQKNYAAAASLLQQLRLLGIDPKDKNFNFVLYKNLGWLQFEQNQLASARANLETATRLVEDQASAHCLLAQVLEKQHEFKTARTHWESCLAYAAGIIPEEAVWIGLAQQRLVTPESSSTSRIEEKK